MRARALCSAAVLAELAGVADGGPGAPQGPGLQVHWGPLRERLWDPAMPGADLAMPGSSDHGGGLSSTAPPPSTATTTKIPRKRQSGATSNAVSAPEHRSRSGSSTSRAVGGPQAADEQHGGAVSSTASVASGKDGHEAQEKEQPTTTASGGAKASDLKGARQRIGEEHDKGPQVAQMGPASMLSKPQKTLLCHLKEAAGERFQTEPPLPIAQNCAVVSHSGGLLFHEHGEDIDSHERVIRFNSNPVNGFEKHVGKKTDVRFGVFPGLEDNEVGDLIVHSIMQPLCGQMNCKRKYGRPVRLITGPPVDADPTFGTIMGKLYPTRAGQNETPALELTTGFDGMLLALTTCRSVEGFEMTPSDIASRCARYAYDSALYPGQADENNWHGYFNAEHDLWARLSVDVGTRRTDGKILLPGFPTLNCDSELPELSSVERDLVAPQSSADLSSCGPPPRRLDPGFLHAKKTSLPVIVASIGAAMLVLLSWMLLMGFAPARGRRWTVRTFLRSQAFEPVVGIPAAAPSLSADSSCQLLPGAVGPL